MKHVKKIVAGFLLIFSLSVLADAHVDEAIVHCNEAVAHAKFRHSGMIKEHADNALKHARMAETSVPPAAKPHVAAAIVELEKAIKHSSMGDAEIAEKALNEALMHLKAAQK